MDRMDLFASALRSAAEQVKCNITQFGEDFPLPCTENGVYPVGINTDWTPACSPASAGWPMRPPGTTVSGRRPCARWTALPGGWQWGRTWITMT